jgi:hypothetical protein
MAAIRKSAGTAKASAKTAMVRVTDASERDAIFKAIAKLDSKLAPEWNELARLVPGAQIDSVEAEGMYKTGDQFEVSATVYVKIPLDGRTSTESFSAHIGGRLMKSKADIKTFSINTSSFFGGEAFPWQSTLS